MQDVNRHAAVYSIGVVKNMTGLSKRQIRYYETTELVIPERTSGNQRLYSMADVEKLLRIKKLLERGLNIDDVRDHFQRREEREVQQNTLPHLGKLAASSDLTANFRRDIEALSGERTPLSDGPSGSTEEDDDPPPTAIPRSLESLYPVKNRPALLETLKKQRTERNEEDEE